MYKNLVRSQLDYCNCLLNPYRKSDIESLENVQKRATKILPKLTHMKYSFDHLKTCKQPILHYRWIREDMIEICKILTLKYDVVAVPNLSIATTLTTTSTEVMI